MPSLFFITHPEVIVDPECRIEDWGLSDAGRRRASHFVQSGFLSDVTAIWSSTELKAMETAGIFADHLELPVVTDPLLGENDRSATGFLPPTEFEAAADAFFAAPETSFRGWERALDAQNRIETATRRIVAQHHRGDLAIVSHGAVGTLLYCTLKNLPISRAHDQPSQGHYWVASFPKLVPIHCWKSLG